jgi:hypothetical protein
MSVCLSVCLTLDVLRVMVHRKEGQEGEREREREKSTNYLNG